MCTYCKESESTILNDIDNMSIPSDALVEACSWKYICKVRGKYLSRINPETWSEICRKRGYLYKRHNSRGF